jgi:exonuclease III
MKIITWNCNMAFRKKANLLLSYGPDILVIPECEHPDKLVFPAQPFEPNEILWFGKNRNKGLAIISFGDFHFTMQVKHNRKLQHIVPIGVRSGGIEFNLFAIWANNPADPDGQYVEQVWKALHYYKSLMKSTNTILAGDFNSNTIWDRKRRAGNHSNVVKFLAEKGIHSTYHLYHKQEQGLEQHPTLYMYRHRDKSYHIDYCFASSDFTTKLLSVEIGDYGFWTKYSDHVPLIVEFSNG